MDTRSKGAIKLQCLHPSQLKHQSHRVRTAHVRTCTFTSIKCRVDNSKKRRLIRCVEILISTSECNTDPLLTLQNVVVSIKMQFLVKKNKTGCDF